MLIIGCDYHPSMQQIALVDTETGECGERRLRHRAEAEEFYRELKGKQVRVGIEATGHSRWFERWLAELNVDRRSSGDPSQAGAQAEERSVRCPTHTEVDAGRYLSSHLGANSGESGSTTAGVAPASPGGNANSSHESAPSRGHERRHTTQTGAVE